MKKYNTTFIKGYIEKHKEEIKAVSCGMREDWRWTAGKVFENGEFSANYDWNKEHISVTGISAQLGRHLLWKLNLRTEEQKLLIAMKMMEKEQADIRFHSRKHLQGQRAAWTAYKQRLTSPYTLWHGLRAKGE